MTEADHRLLDAIKRALPELPQCAVGSDGYLLAQHDAEVVLPVPDDRGV